MSHLTEIEYEDIFSPKTIASLKGKSGQSLKKMLGNKNLMQTLRNTQELLDKIIQAEDGYQDELEMVAIQMAKDAYPILDYADIEIDAKIVKRGDINVPMGGENEEDPASPSFGEDDSEKLEAKRRIINGITQGASIRGAFGFMLFREYLDEINPEIVENYNEILKLVFGIFDDENAIAMMLNQLAQGQKMEGGSSDMEYNDEEEKFVIKARALCFPMLVHEIIKGLYEIVGTQGFSFHPSDKAQRAVTKVDVIQGEPHDMQYGKFIYDALSKLYNESNVNDPRVRELFFTEVYKMNENEFFSFIENAINDELSVNQKKWALDTMKDIERDLQKDDTGLEDLDEIKRMQQLAGIKEIKVNKPINLHIPLKLEFLQEIFDFFKNDQNIFKGSGIDRVIASKQKEIIHKIWEFYVESGFQEMDQEYFENENKNDYPKTEPDILNPHKQTMLLDDAVYIETGMFLLPYIAKYLKKNGWEYQDDGVFFSKDDEDTDIFEYIEPLENYDSDPRENLQLKMGEWLQEN